jgi:WD40 repeat protein
VRLFATRTLTTVLEFGTDLASEDYPSQKPLTFAPNGRICATTTSDYKIQLWDIENGAMTSILEGHAKYIKSLVFSLDSLLLASISDDRTGKVWNIKTGTTTCSFSTSSRLEDATFSPTGKMLATHGSGTIKLWDTGSGQLEKSLDLGEVSRKLSFSADGIYLQNSFGKLAVDISVSDKASDVHAAPCWQFAFHHRWLTCNGCRILWLPHEYDENYLDFYDNIIAILTDSGVPILLTVDITTDPSTSAVSISLGTPWT